MSLEKLAKVLHVDEVSLMHGPLGVAVHVRIEKSWHSATIDNDDLGDRRLEVIAEHLAHLSDVHIHKVRDSVSKGFEACRAAATRAALQADVELDAARRRGGGWGTGHGARTGSSVRTTGATKQVYREPVRVAQEVTATPPLEPATTAPMQSRFHAILAELRDL
jgi:hypothetical protein